MTFGRKHLESSDIFQVCVAGGEKAVTDLAITDMDHKVAALPGGAPLRDEPNQWFPRVALRVDLQMLEQVEVLEDKVANASMQVKVSNVPVRRIHILYIVVAM